MSGCDFEAMMVRGVVYSYARRLAEAWQSKDEDRVQEIKFHIESNYGRPALVHIAELAVLLVMNEG